MPLVKSVLVEGIRDAIENKPGDIPEMATRWSNLYDDYAKDAIAGPVLPTLSKPLIKTPLLSVSNSSQNFYQQLAAGVNAYWQAAVWVDTAGLFVGVTTVNLPLTPLLTPLIASLKVSGVTTDDSIDMISSILDSHARSIVVTTTNTTTAVTAPAPVT